MIEGFPDAFEMFEAEDKDTPRDCHIHCTCWAEKGSCCECGDFVDVRMQGDGYTIEDEHADRKSSADYGTEIPRYLGGERRPQGESGLDPLTNGADVL